MTINALSDIDFLVLDNGRFSVRETLLNCHEPEFQLDKQQPGYVYTAQLRLLCQVAAVALRFESTRPRNLPKEGFSQEAIDEALSSLAVGSDPFDKTFPFMQRPALPQSNATDKSRELGPGKQPVKKLSPSMLSDEGDHYWNLLTSSKEELPLADAILQLVVYHHMSMAGNNAYDGDKCQMGSPAMRFVGADLTATEMIFHGKTLMDTLLYQIPASWVEGEGLPAWADRTCEKSLTESSGIMQAHPLWRATWSSNTPACYWEDNVLRGVRTGGIPESWYLKHEMGTTKESRKSWWDDRNTRDPFYLYMPNQDNELKVQRLDFGRDGTDLAIEWATRNKSKFMLLKFEDRLLGRPADDTTILFARHQIAGTASSPNIRASEIFLPNKNKWAFDLDDETRETIQAHAEMVQGLHGIVTRPFRRKPSNANGPIPVLEDLAGRKQDVTTEFWRRISSLYVEMLADIRSHHASFADEAEKPPFKFTDKFKTRCVETTLDSFDTVVNPHSEQEPARIAYVRGSLQRILYGYLSKFQNTSEEEKS